MIIKKELAIFTSPRTTSTILLCYMSLFLHCQTKLSEIAPCPSLSGIWSLKVFLLNSSSCNLDRSSSTGLISIFLQDNKKNLPTKYVVLGNGPCLCGPPLLCFNQGWRYFFVDLFLSQRALAWCQIYPLGLNAVFPFF